MSEQGARKDATPQPPQQARSATTRKPPPSPEQEQLRRLKTDRRRRLIKVGIAAALAAVLIVFVLANSQTVVVDFVFFTRRPRLIWVMFACIVGGAIVGYLIARPGKDLRASKKQASEQEAARKRAG